MAKIGEAGKSARRGERRSRSASARALRADGDLDYGRKFWAAHTWPEDVVKNPQATRWTEGSVMLM